MRTLTVAFMLAALLLAFPLPAQADDNISITLIDEGAPGIIFGEVTPGSEDSPDIAQKEGTPAVGVQVGSETAVNVDISIRGTTTDIIPLSEWEYSTTFNGAKIPLSSDYKVVYSGVSSNSTYAFYHWVDVPAGTPAGSCNCTIYYKAVALP